MEKLFEAMDIAEDQKVALQESFDKAVLKETTRLIDEHVENIVQEKVQLIEEEYKEKITLLEDSLDGYLDTVVEEFVTENAPTYEAQIEEEKTKTLLRLFDQMIEVAGVDMLSIKEAKEIRDEEEFNESAEGQLEVLKANMADMADKLVEARREADKFLQNGLIKEVSEGLTVLEASKFEKLAEMVQFERTPAYLEKLETIKESIIDSRAEDFSTEAPTLPQTAFKKDPEVDPMTAMDFGKYI